VPIATPEIYNEMLDKAKSGSFAYPAINVTSTETLNAALRGFAEAQSDGIVQVSTGGAEFLSGTTVKDMVTGAVGLAEFAHVVAKKYPVNVALHTDHCPKDKLDTYVRPLIAISQERVDRGENPLFQSHMWDGSATELHENLRIAAELLDLAVKARIILEVEIGVVGGEEDGVANDINEKLYTAEGDFVATARALGLGEKGVYLLAATFGNVHGIHAPGHVKLRPEILGEGQAALAARRPGARFQYVFHGSSGSHDDDVRAAIAYGVVKVNVDSDAQYALTRAVADHVLVNYAGVLRVDGGVGDKTAYDPRAWGERAESAMAARVTAACELFGSAGRSLTA
jgi:fructose-bisphosphate aldolase class II